MKMKVLLKIFAMAAVTVLLQSCIDDTIGASLIDTRNSIINDSAFVITGRSVENKRLQARTSTQLLGLIKSDGYGTLSSQVLTQFMPSSSIDTVDVTEGLIDSCRLVLRIASGGFTGDQIVPMRLSVYRLSKALEAPLFSDIDPTDYYDKNNLLGEAPYSPQSATTVYLNSSDLKAYKETYVPMPIELARDLFTQFKRDPEMFASPSAFAQYFPGMFITNSFGSGRMMNFDYTEFEVYYRKKLISSVGADSLSATNKKVYMSATPEVLSDNVLKLEVDPSVKEMIDDGNAIIMAPAGYEVRINFPIQEIIDRFNNSTGNDIAVINKLSLTIPVEDVATDYNIEPPANLLMVKTSRKNEFIAGDSLTNDKDSFYASYDSKNKCYTFSGMRDYILDIIQNKGGVADAEDMDITVTPVDVTTYTIPASYTTSERKVVTKIAPQVSKPAIAKLRLDKAKASISYSKQTVL